MSTSLPPPDPDAIDEGWDALDVPVAPANSPIHSSSPPARTLTAEPRPEAKVQVAPVLPSSVSAQLDRPAAAEIPPTALSSVSAVAAPQKKIAADVAAVAAPQKKIAAHRSERGKAKLQAKSKEQVAARAAKKAAKRMAKQAERRERAQRNSRAAADEAASKRQPQRSASSNNGTAARVRKVPRAASPATMSSEAEHMVVAPAVHTESWFKRTLSGSIALLLVTLLLLAGLGWFLWPRS